MPRVTVKDMNQQEFLRALASFLKKSGKLKVLRWVDMVKLAKHKELAPYNENWFYTWAASLASHLYLPGLAPILPQQRQGRLYDRDPLGCKRNSVMPSHFSWDSKGMARRVLQVLNRIKKDQDGGQS